MATKVDRKFCSVCWKGKIVYACEGCSKEFCLEHLLEHRQLISKQFDEFENEYDQFRQKLFEQKHDEKQQRSLQQINQWEIDSIMKVKQIAQKCRQTIIIELNKDFKQIENRLNQLADQIRTIRHEDEFHEIHLEEFKTELECLNNEFNQSSMISIPLDPISFLRKSLMVNLEKNDATILDLRQLIADSSINEISSDEINVQTKKVLLNFVSNIQWTPYGVTVAGGRGSGEAMNQLNGPVGFHVDENQTIYVADFENHRIVKWKSNATSGQVVAGGNGQGNRTDQLSYPTDVTVEKMSDCLIICDAGNRRIMRWSRKNDTTNGEIILDNIMCNRLTMDDQNCLYVSDYEKVEVRRYRIGESTGTVVAGGNGRGDRLNQLNNPSYIFVDQDYSVYVSDCNNQRVMKWMKGATEGIVVAGGHGAGNGLTQLSNPLGLIVDSLGIVYVVDRDNHRVMRWCNGATEGEIVIGGSKDKGNQLYYPDDLSFDQYGHLYVVDYGNNRVQRFSFDTN